MPEMPAGQKGHQESRAAVGAASERARGRGKSQEDSHAPGCRMNQMVDSGA